MRKTLFIFAGVAAIFLFGYIVLKERFSNLENFTDIPMGDFILKTTAFKEGETIPSKHTCDGDDVNPMLEIKNVPENTASLALIMDDPDATRGVPWDHWILWNIPARTQYIPEDSIPPGAVQGTTSFSRQKYGGPCPPKGSGPHRYMFKLYALDTELNLPEGATKETVEKAMAGHILEQTTLMGRYSRIFNLGGHS